MDEVIATIVALTIFISLLCGIEYIIESKECSSKWESSGMKSDYGFFKGCTVQQKDGTWIPSNNYRALD